MSRPRIFLCDENTEKALVDELRKLGYPTVWINDGSANIPQGSSDPSIMVAARDRGDIIVTGDTSLDRIVPADDIDPYPTVSFGPNKDYLLVNERFATGRLKINSTGQWWRVPGNHHEGHNGIITFEKLQLNTRSDARKLASKIHSYLSNAANPYSRVKDIRL